MIFPRGCSTRPNWPGKVGRMQLLSVVQSPAFITWAANRRFFVIVLIVLALSAVPTTAQQYSVLGSLSLSAQTRLPSGQSFNNTNSWQPNTGIGLELNHTLDMPMAGLVVEHRISGDATSYLGASNTIGTIDLDHRLYRAYLDLFLTPTVTVSAGRQRMSWGKGYAFSATDAFHPASVPVVYGQYRGFSLLTSGGEADVGYDGMGVQYLPGPNLSVEGAVALEHAVESGSLEDLRYALYATGFFNRLETSASLVYQPKEVLRPGLSGSIPIYGVLLSGEIALELQDLEPKEEKWPQPFDFQDAGEYLLNEMHRLVDPFAWNLAAEYTFYGEGWDLTILGEFATSNLSVDSQAPVWGLASVSYMSDPDWSTEIQTVFDPFNANVLTTWGTSLTRFQGLDLRADISGIGTELNEDPGWEWYLTLTAEVLF